MMPTVIGLYIYQFTRHLQLLSTDGKYTVEYITHIKHHSLDSISFDKVCHRFKLVRRDLEGVLVDEVNVIVGHCSQYIQKSLERLSVKPTSVCCC